QSSGPSNASPIFAGIPRLMIDRGYLTRLFDWELWAMLRWWILFGTWATAWLVVARPLRYRWPLEPPAACYRRLLAFAPWLVTLEIAFLIGVWMTTPNVVPEPSTGFVEGIFSWDLWHWDCWKGPTWINRGLLPTWLIATVFARCVLRWRWPPAL